LQTTGEPTATSTGKRGQALQPISYSRFEKLEIVSVHSGDTVYTPF
jgi:hypothetical protein